MACVMRFAHVRFSAGRGHGQGVGPRDPVGRALDQVAGKDGLDDLEHVRSGTTPGEWWQALSRFPGQPSPSTASPGNRFTWRMGAHSSVRVEPGRVAQSTAVPVGSAIRTMVPWFGREFIRMLPPYFSTRYWADGESHPSGVVSRRIERVEDFLAFLAVDAYAVIGDGDGLRHCPLPGRSQSG